MTPYPAIQYSLPRPAQRHKDENVLHRYLLPLYSLPISLVCTGTLEYRHTVVPSTRLASSCLEEPDEIRRVGRTKTEIE